jgi:hypothetical protein
MRSTIGLSSNPLVLNGIAKVLADWFKRLLWQALSASVMA